MPTDETLKVSRQPRDPGAETDRKSLIIEALARLDPEVADWYRGAMSVVASPANPERLHQAAHSLRELMNAVGRLAGLPQEAEERLGDQVAKMTQAWKRGERTSECYAEGVWSGLIDEPAGQAFAAVAAVIAWNEENRGTRRQVFLEAARKLDGSGRRLPHVAETKMWQAWDGLKSYFNGVAKHSKRTDGTEFLARVEELDEFVVQLVGRDVYAEQKAIAALIEEAESGA